VFTDLAPNIFDIFVFSFQFFIRGGWVLFVIAILYVLYKTYRKEISHQFVHNVDWVFLNIKVPKDNLTSMLGVESVFSQLHSLNSGLTFPQIYIEGRIQLWYSFEIISMGGKVSFIIRAPKQVKNVIESAFYSQYPQCEINEVDDYMEHFHFDPENPGDLEIWGTEWKLSEDWAIPLKTYKDFEHPTAEDKIIDPLAGHFEALGKMAPHEFFGVQILAQTLPDEEWKPHGEELIKKLTGEETPHHTGILDLLMAPLNWFANFSLLDFITSSGQAHEESANKPKNNWVSMTEAEKERVSLIEKKIGKPGYKVKIRNLYIAPKDKFDVTKRSMIVASYRPLGSAMTNKIKPENSKTWTSVDYKFSPNLEKPYLDWLLKKKKRNIFKGYKERDIHIGLPFFILNSEELATLYHFPLTTKTTSAPASVERTESKKSQPPVNLPVLEDIV